MTPKGEIARIIRIFVSSPGDVAEERKVLDEVVSRINRTDSQARNVRLEVFKWETHVSPTNWPQCSAGGRRADA